MPILGWCQEQTQTSRAQALPREMGTPGNEPEGLPRPGEGLRGWSVVEWVKVGQEMSCHPNKGAF